MFCHALRYLFTFVTRHLLPKKPLPSFYEIVEPVMDRFILFSSLELRRARKDVMPGLLVREERYFDYILSNK
jgi:hypothetical protein